jgi:hypothetical protein
MEREDQAPRPLALPEVPEPPQLTPQAPMQFVGGELPAVLRSPEIAPAPPQLTASQKAFDAAAPGDREQNAAAGARELLAYIQAQARIVAKDPGRIEKNTMLFERLTQHYLPDYLASPSPASGKAAVDKIGEQADPKKADPNDYWESGAEQWNAQDVPPALKLLLPKAPDKLGAATAALKQENRKHLPYLDAPQMIGDANEDTGKDADVYGGGKNVSQLMHWASGVKYSEQDPSTMRDLFLAYENFHLEGWDMFGEDSINDMMSEDAGRIMGRQLQAGEITNDNFQDKLNAGFDEARAWVGTLVRARQPELDAVVTSKTVVQSKMWWGAGDDEEPVKWWGESSPYLDLMNGMTVEQLKHDERTQHYIGVYALIYSADKWEKEHHKIKHSHFTDGMLKHKYDTAFAKSVKEQPLTNREKADAYLDARAPWVPGSVRRIAGKKDKGGGK